VLTLATNLGWLILALHKSLKCLKFRGNIPGKARNLINEHPSVKRPDTHLARLRGATHGFATLSSQGLRHGLPLHGLRKNERGISEIAEVKGKWGLKGTGGECRLGSGYSGQPDNG
jgi:hypothetical protein